jgi:hypothetical protein
MNNINLNRLNRDELNELLEKVMLRLRQLDAEQIKKEFVTQSQKLRLETAEKHLVLQD